MLIAFHIGKLAAIGSFHFHTWRYSHWLWVDDELWVYAEVVRPNESHEIRLFRMSRSPSADS